MHFEKLHSSDLDDAKTLQPEDWPDIVSDFNFYIEKNFCHPIKAVIKNRIVGLGTYIIFEETSWLAHIIVDVNYRNRGIGSHIVGELLEQVRKHSIQTCLLAATDLGKPVYQKAGFRAVGEYTFFERESPWLEKQVSDNIFPFKDEYRSAIYRMDKSISGENREQLLADFTANALVYVENNKVLGYYIPDLKEGFIFADQTHAGIELMKIKYARTNRAVLPTANTTAIGFLKQEGFKETGRKATRMALGRNIDWKYKKVYSRIGGNFG